MELHKVKPIKGNKSKSKRRARGVGSGKGGHTMGKGMKGQKSRAGKGIRLGFEGGQVPFYMRIPEIGGFNNPTSKKIHAVGIGKLNKFDEGSKVTPQDLVEAGIIRKVPKHGVKLIVSGKISKKLTLVDFIYSAGAIKELEKAGCTIQS